MRRKNLIEPGDFEYLTDEAGQTADPEVSAFVAQLLGDGDERTKPHAADVCEIAQIDDEAWETLCNAGLALPFKLNSILGVHAAGYMQHNLIPDLGLFNGHSIPRVHHAATDVNHLCFTGRLREGTPKNEESLGASSPGILESLSKYEPTIV